MPEPAIEISPHPQGFQVDEGGGLAPIHAQLEHAISYAVWRAGFHKGREVHVLTDSGSIDRVIRPEEIERSAGYGTMR